MKNPLWGLVTDLLHQDRNGCLCIAGWRKQIPLKKKDIKRAVELARGLPKRENDEDH